MKKLILPILLLLVVFLPTSLFSGVTVTIIGGSAALSCAGCNTGNDAALEGDSDQGDLAITFQYICNDGNDDVFSQQFTFAAETCVTGYNVRGKLVNSPVSTFNVQIYSDSSGPNTPVENTAATKATATFPAVYTNFQMDLASTQTLPAGTYHMVMWISNVTTHDGANYVAIRGNTAQTGMWKQDPASGCGPDATGWALEGTQSAAIEVWGCAPS